MPRTPKRKVPAGKAAKTPGKTPGSDWANGVVFESREAKQAVSLRLDADVLRYFRSMGAGYQTRINEVLRVFMEARPAAEPKSKPKAKRQAGRPSA